MYNIALFRTTVWLWINWALSCELVPEDLCHCHTQRRIGGGQILLWVWQWVMSNKRILSKFSKHFQFFQIFQNFKNVLCCHYRLYNLIKCPCNSYADLPACQGIFSHDMAQIEKGTVGGRLMGRNMRKISGYYNSSVLQGFPRHLKYCRGL